MKKICVFIPYDNKEKVKAAMFEAGAGKIGNYQKCCFEVEGLGQFLPIEGARPFLGKVSQLTIVEEVKVEMVCEDDFVKDVIWAMKNSHPYECPAFDVIDLNDNYC